MGGRGASSGKRTKRNEQRFEAPGLGKVSKEAVKAIFEAPVGSKIRAETAGFGSYDTNNYEITTRGMTKRMLTRVREPGEGYRPPLVLSRANIRKVFGGARIILEYPGNRQKR